MNQGQLIILGTQLSQKAATCRAKRYPALAGDCGKSWAIDAEAKFSPHP